MKRIIFLAVAFLLACATGTYAGTTYYTGSTGDTVPIETWGSGPVINECSFTMPASTEAVNTNDWTASDMTNNDKWSGYVSLDFTNEQYDWGAGAPYNLPAMDGFGTFTFELVDPVPVGTGGGIYFESRWFQNDAWDARGTIMVGLLDGAWAVMVAEGQYVTLLEQATGLVTDATTCAVTLDLTGITVDIDSSQVYTNTWETIGLANTPATDWYSWSAIRQLSDSCLAVNELVWNGSGVANTNSREGEGEGELAAPVTNGAPVAGLMGLGLVAAVCALGGASALRRH